MAGAKTKTNAKFYAGQEVCVVWTYNYQHRPPEWAEIDQIGRKWGYLKGQQFSGDKFDLTTGQCNERFVVMVDPSIWAKEVALKRTYARLRNSMGHEPREGVTAEAIKQAASLLGIDIEIEAPVIPPRPSHE